MTFIVIFLVSSFRKIISPSFWIRILKNLESGFMLELNACNRSHIENPHLDSFQHFSSGVRFFSCFEHMWEVVNELFENSTCLRSNLNSIYMRISKSGRLVLRFFVKPNFRYAAKRMSLGSGFDDLFLYHAG